MKTAFVLLADTDVVDIWDQPPTLVYRDARGVAVSHTPDFLVTHVDSTKTVIQVKPDRRCAKAKRQVDTLAKEAPPGYADRYVVVTEKDLDRTTVHDVSLIHDMRRHADPIAEQRVNDLVVNLYGVTSVRSLVDASGCGPAGFAAVIAAIGDGVLHKTSTLRLGYASFVARSPAPLSIRR